MNTYTLIAKQLPDGRVLRGGDYCGQGSCPAVIRSANGKIVVVGRLLSNEEHAAITNIGMIQFHGEEVGIEVNPELLKQAVHDL